MKIVGKYSMKDYKCTKCQTITKRGTNHWGEIYPLCRRCGNITVMECMEALPEGYERPEPWHICHLADIAIIEDRGRG